MNPAANPSANDLAGKQTMVKGASILARIEHIQKTHGDDILAAVLATMAPADRAILEARVLPATPYPLTLNGRLDEAIAQVLDPIHPHAVFHELGRASAERNLTSVHRIFTRGTAPHDLLENFPSVRRTYYSDGEASYERTDEHHGVLHVVGASSHTSPDCLSTAGYFERGIELLGGKGASVMVQCRRDAGHRECVFTCSWQPEAGGS